MDNRRPSISKRQKEMARQQKQKEKAARREHREIERAQRGNAAEGEDPDIAGIVPGPQPKPWEGEEEPKTGNPSGSEPG